MRTRSTTEDAIGFGRTGGSQSRSCPSSGRCGRGLHHQIAARAVHPVEHLDTRCIARFVQGLAPAFIHHDGADRNVRMAALGAFGTELPWRVDCADEIHAGVGVRRQRNGDFAGANFSVDQVGSSLIGAVCREGRPEVQVRSEGGGDSFHFGVVVEHFLAHLAAPAGLLVTAERQRGVEHVVAIDPDRAGADAAGQLVRGAAVAGPDAGGEAVDRVVGWRAIWSRSSSPKGRVYGFRRARTKPAARAAMASRAMLRGSGTLAS